MSHRSQSNTRNRNAKSSEIHLFPTVDEFLEKLVGNMLRGPRHRRSIARPKRNRKDIPEVRLREVQLVGVAPTNSLLPSQGGNLDNKVPSAEGEILSCEVPNGGIDWTFKIVAIKNSAKRSCTREPHLYPARKFKPSSKVMAFRA